jgi:hypothetical protein
MGYAFEMHDGSTPYVSDFDDAVDALVAEMSQDAVRAEEGEEEDGEWFDDDEDDDEYDGDDEHDDDDDDEEYVEGDEFDDDDDDEAEDFDFDKFDEAERTNATMTTTCEFFHSFISFAGGLATSRAPPEPTPP